MGLEFDSAEDDTTPLEPNAPTLSLLLLEPELPEAVVDEVLLLPMEFCKKTTIKLSIILCRAFISYN
jgi:hypothetical protein